MKRKAERRVKDLARSTAQAERREEAEARKLVRRAAQAPYLAMLEDAAPTMDLGRGLYDPDEVLKRAPRRRRALLIINAKSGPKGDSLSKVREIADTLARLGIGVDVRVKLRKSLARRQARRAARKGFRLVIAAGGDGTIGAVAQGLLGTRTTLGIIPLGTYDNTATSLGIPRDTHAACMLIAHGRGRPIDLGDVKATGGQKRRVFLEMGAVGLAGALIPLGQHMEKGRWDAAMNALPAALQMSPTFATACLDDQDVGLGARTLLVVVANGPRAGAGLSMAPAARMDDGLLDVYVYPEMDQAALAARFVAARTGVTAIEQGAEHARARKVRVESVSPLPVVADARLVGITPATFRIRPGAVRVIVGNGPGLHRPAADVLVQAAASVAQAVLPETDVGNGRVIPVPVEPNVLHLPSVTPALSHAMGNARASRSQVVPIVVAALVGGLAAPLLRRLRKR